MKKLTKFASVLLTSLLLASCGETTNDDFRLYKHSYDNGKSFETMKQNESSDKDVFVFVVIAGNDSDKSVEVKASDFKLTFDKKDYTALFFVQSYSYESITVDGEQKSITYVKTSSEAKTFEPNSKELQNLQIAFEEKTDGDYTISYKGNALKRLGE